MGRTYNVIDADGHVLEPVDIWEKYMDPAYRDRAPRIIVDKDGKERLNIEGKILGSPKGLGNIGAIGARQGDVAELTMKYVEGRKGGFDPHARIPDMDLDGIDAAFLYPSLGLFSGAIQDPPLAAAVCRAYNRWLADYCKPYPDRLFGVAMLPMQSIDLAIEEMRFARRQLGMRGGFLRPNPYNGRMLHHPDYAPGAPHHLPHPRDDAGGHERDLGGRVRQAPEGAHRLPGVGRRVDRPLARPHGSSFRRQ